MTHLTAGGSSTKTKGHSAFYDRVAARVSLCNPIRGPRPYVKDGEPEYEILTADTPLDPEPEVCTQIKHPHSHKPDYVPEKID